MEVSEEETAPLVNRERMDSHRSSSGLGLQVHLYFSPAQKDEMTFCIASGQISAEDICTIAAKECGILPVYHSLFGLASEDLSYWFPPCHVFNLDEYLNLTVHYRVRFFFSDWFGQGSRKTYRYGLPRSRISAVLDYSVIGYLFAQSRSDFVNGKADVSPPLSVKEECLGLAVLDLWRLAEEQNQRCLKDICKTISYKSCLPESHRQNIQQLSRLTRFRIRKTLKHFLNKLGRCPAGGHSLKLKYLMELAAVEPRHGTEGFQVRTPGCSSLTTEPTSKSLLVSGEMGIQSRTPGTDWQTFCDFPEITEISMKQAYLDQVPLESRIVTVTRQDDRRLEAEFQTLSEARSFVALLDGYFRLTTDSSHYFCQEVAPPSLLHDIECHCHGPITSEFAVHKLKKSGPKSGMFLLRRSPQDFDKYFLTVCVQTPLGMDYKDCLIVTDKGFRLSGVSSSFPSLKALVTFYQENELLLADLPTKLGRCCAPRPKELTNMIILRNGSKAEELGSPAMPRRKASSVQFHMIKNEDLKLGESLGQGTFTRIFKGYKSDVRDGERNTADVLIKVLDNAHQNCWESFFEAASLMSQISHKHLILVYGISVNRSEHLMVQEFVKYGALDLYLRKHQGCVPVSWKLDIAKQLACVLNFLEEKKIVHGHISAKNLLLAREGEPSTGSCPFIKLSDPGVSVTVLERDVTLDRIPWVAPEVLEMHEKLGLDSDKWSFGTTLWEIFNEGKPPLQGCDPQQKLLFYANHEQLPSPKWTELADLIGRCMDYEPALRPSSRGIIRQLNNLITSDYELLDPGASAVSDKDSFWRTMNISYQEQLSLYEERHLRYISALGKGNFGSVELCRYDPLGDNTGELIAVKKLQPNKQSSMADFQREIQTTSSLHCDYIVKYLGICYSMGRLNVSLVMEYLPNGSLISYLEKNRENVSCRRLLLFASQICKGMEYLQSMRYVHRDLAARNILVASESLVKIADFGLTKIIPFDKDYYRVTKPGDSPIFWYAPESITESKFSHKSDVWSFGIVLHELFSYCEHNQNPKKLYLQKVGKDMQIASISMHLVSVLKDKWRLPAPQHCPQRVHSMMLKCWAFCPEERPSFTNLAEMIDTCIQDDRESSKG
uniref:Tyrosine-protein kinase n=1 Tax=Paramormyrops kingsleyae TaxID=1676925 RepID=A0A3B3S3J0_9TELE|nr:tyrosine-protein kinase JAK3 [Paramormyrops kingsleyae]